MLLSVIIPIYNVERYLCRCIDSLIKQDLPEEEYEIILVDDGSPDKCRDICNTYAAKYGNIRAIHQKNSGLSAARNTGIEAASGKYIQFVDSDDYLEPNVLKGLVDKMESDELDILRFNYQNVNEQYEVFEPNKVSKPFVDYTDSVCDGLSFLTERLGFACYAVQFVVRSELLKPQENHFKTGIYFEDTEWTPRILTQSNRVTSVDTIVYNYLMREGSITKSTDYKKKVKVLDDKVQLIESMIQQKEGKTDKRWYDGMIAQTAISIIAYACANFAERKNEYIKRLKSLDIFPLSYFHSTALSARKIKIANISPYLLSILLRIKN